MTKRRNNANCGETDHESKDEAMQLDGNRDQFRSETWKGARNHTSKKKAILAFLALLIICGLGAVAIYFGRKAGHQYCSHWDTGYQCYPQKSRYWGQYSPYFDVRKTEEYGRLKKTCKGYPHHDHIPKQCSITMVSVLSRHGARAPTSGKDELYNATVSKIQSRLKHRNKYKSRYNFLQDYEYNFNPDELNDFGREQLKDSGKQFFERYKYLIRDQIRNGYTPFIRAGSQHRVFESGKFWCYGLQNAIQNDGKLKKLGSQGILPNFCPYEILSIPECSSCNNTLHHSRCPAHEDGLYSDIRSRAQDQWANIFVPKIASLLNEDIDVDGPTHPEDLITTQDVLNLMQLCAFDTLKHVRGSPLSPFCNLFTRQDFENLDYYQTLNKYYGYGGGNPLGPTQGVGWANELLARLTNTPVLDHTSTNSTLDGNPTTFPLPVYGNTTQIYADFTHDNDLISMLWALRLFDDVPRLNPARRMDTVATRGFSSAWVAPFGSRVYVEKLSCDFSKGKSRHHKRDDHIQMPQFILDSDTRKDYVRIVVNDRVMPMPFCRSDSHGLCLVDDFVSAQGFARSGGRWEKCFVSDDDDHLDGNVEWVFQDKEGGDCGEEGCSCGQFSEREDEVGGRGWWFRDGWRPGVRMV